MKKHFMSFAVGSSMVVNIFPLGALALASRDKPLDILDWRAVFIVIPIAFGIANLLTVGPLRRTTRAGFAMVGAALGVVLSMTGTFLFNVPELVYGLGGNSRYLALVLGPILYGLIWAVVLYPVDRAFGLVAE